MSHLSTLDVDHWESMRFMQTLLTEQKEGYNILLFLKYLHCAHEPFCGRHQLPHHRLALQLHRALRLLVSSKKVPGRSVFVLISVAMVVATVVAILVAVVAPFWPDERELHLFELQTENSFWQLILE